MTSRRGRVTDRVKKKARTKATAVTAPTTLKRSARSVPMRVSKSFMKPLSRRAPTTRPPASTGMLRYIMSVLRVELARIDICRSPRREAWISGRKRWFSMSRASFSESARTTPAASMTVIRVPVLWPCEEISPGSSPPEAPVSR